MLGGLVSCWLAARPPAKPLPGLQLLPMAAHWAAVQRGGCAPARQFSSPSLRLSQDVEEPEQLALPLPRPAAPPGTAGINYFSVVCLLRG